MSASSPSARRPLRNLLIVILNLFLLPADTYILLCTYVLQILRLSKVRHEHSNGRARSTAKTRVVLVTGVGTVKGLSLARALYNAGHRVIGADFDAAGVPAYCRFSVSLKKYHSLPLPGHDPVAYARTIEAIVKGHGVHLWIPCSDIPDPVEESRVAEIVRRRTMCAVLAFDTAMTATLQDPVKLAEHTSSIGLPVLETKAVSSRDSVHRILAGAQKRDKRYTMITRNSSHAGTVRERPLPHRSLSQTYAQISRIDMSNTKPWVIREFVEGDLYHSHSLVVCGEVVAFVAWHRREKSQYLEILRETSALSKAMLMFTSEFVSKSHGIDNGHLDLAFTVCERSTAEGSRQSLFLSGCSTAPHEISALLDKQPRLSARLYLKSIEAPQTDHISQTQVVVLSQPIRMSLEWFGHDLTFLACTQVSSPVQSPSVLRRASASLTELMVQLFRHRTLAYAVHDPLPWWYLHHIEIPLTLALNSFFGYSGSKRKPPSPGKVKNP